MVSRYTTCLLFVSQFITYLSVCRGQALTDGAHGETVVKDVVKQVHDSGIFPNDKCFLIRIAWVESKYGDDSNTYRSGYYGGIWQVDEVGFQDTKDTGSHSGLNNKFTKIQNYFGIWWPSVTWQDLRKPLYSGLAARLFLSNFPSAIPVDISGQATYWKTNYNTDAGAGTAQKFIDDISHNGKLSDCNTDGDIVAPPSGPSGEGVTKNAILKIQDSGIFPDDKCFLARIAWVESQFGTDPDTYRTGYYGGIWQVDEAAFDDTQDTSMHSLLPSKFEKIFDRLGIEWAGVKWEELVDPLHSVLAARLYLSNVPSSIPPSSDVSGQAVYWRDHYSSDAGATTDQFISGLTGAPDDLCTTLVTTSTPAVTTSSPVVTTEASADTGVKLSLCYDIPGEDGDIFTFLDEPSLGLNISVRIESLPDNPDVKVIAELFITIGSFYLHIDFDGVTHNGEHFSWSLPEDIKLTSDIRLHIDKTGIVLDYKGLVWLEIKRKQKNGVMYINLAVNHLLGQITKNALGLIGSFSATTELSEENTLANLIMTGLDGVTSFIGLIPTNHCWKLPSNAMNTNTEIKEKYESNKVGNKPKADTNGTEGDCSKVEIISRTVWGAKNPSKYIGPLPNKPVQYSFVHHTDTPSCFDQTKCMERMRSIQHYHMTNAKRMYSDIGYNFLVGEDGRVYEGRGLDKQGAHTYGHNSKSIAVSVIGNFQTALPNKAALDAVRNILDCAVKKDVLASNFRLYGHRDVGCTPCPGQALYDEIKSWPQFSSDPLPCYCNAKLVPC